MVLDEIKTTFTTRKKHDNIPKKCCDCYISLEKGASAMSTRQYVSLSILI